MPETKLPPRSTWPGYIQRLELEARNGGGEAWARLQVEIEFHWWEAAKRRGWHLISSAKL